MKARGQYKKPPSVLDEGLLQSLQWKRENIPKKPQNAGNAVHFEAPKDAVKFKKTKGDKLDNIRKWLRRIKDNSATTPEVKAIAVEMTAYIKLKAKKDPDNKHIKKALRFCGGLSMKIKPNTALEGVLLEAVKSVKESGHQPLGKKMLSHHRDLEKGIYEDTPFA